jgi:hypothetical protein
MVAIETEQKDMVAMLIYYGTDVNQRLPRTSNPIGTVLHAATISGPTITKLILNAEVNLEVINDYGQTPLEEILNPYIGRLPDKNEVIRLLVDAGAKITPESWVRFPPELQEQYADRSPFRPLDPGNPLFDEMLDIDAELNVDEEDNEEPLGMSHPPSTAPMCFTISDNGGDIGSDQDDEMEEVDGD